MLIGAYPTIQGDAASPNFAAFSPVYGSRPPVTPFGALTTALNLQEGTATAGSSQASVTSSPDRPSTIQVVAGVAVDVLNSILYRRGSNTQVGVVVGPSAPGGGVSTTAPATFEAGTIRDRQPILFYAGAALAAFGLYRLVKS